MKSAFRFLCVASAAMCVLLSSAAAQAATFSSLSQSRSIAASAQVELISFNQDEVLSVSGLLSGGAQTNPGDFSTFDQSFGLGALSIEDPVLGYGRGNGRAAQTSSFTAGLISFNGTADVNMEGEPTPGFADIIGSGSASSRLSYSFSLDQAASVRLTMSSNLTPSRSGYTFSLAQGDSSIWNDTSIFDANGNEVRDFSVVLNLGAGTYDLNTVLGASSFITNSSSGAGRAVATFSLQALPVPEPATALQILAGLLLIAAFAAGPRSLLPGKAVVTADTRMPHS